MAVYKKHGFAFTKNLVFLNKDKTKILFGAQISIGINADVVQNFKQTANWIFIGGGFNKKMGDKIPGLDMKWNVKSYI